MPSVLGAKHLRGKIRSYLRRGFYGNGEWGMEKGALGDERGIEVPAGGSWRWNNYHGAELMTPGSGKKE